jgi:hypothetical protein
MGSEAIVGLAMGLVGFLTWSHERRQKTIDVRFDSVKRKIEATEKTLAELPLKYVLKSDLDSQLDDIRGWLKNINNKLDQLILSKTHD